VDAFVPESGKCALDYVVAERGAAMRAAGEARGTVPPPPMSLWGHTDPALMEWLRPREVPHPYRAFTQPIRLANGAALARVPKTFIYLLLARSGSFDQFAAKYRADIAVLLSRFGFRRIARELARLQQHRVVPLLILVKRHALSARYFAANWSKLPVAGEEQ